jgi:hypothetical protein
MEQVQGLATEYKICLLMECTNDGFLRGNQTPANGGNIGHGVLGTVSMTQSLLRFLDVATTHFNSVTFVNEGDEQSNVFVDSIGDTLV